MPLFSFTAHRNGRNATLSVYPDRLTLQGRRNILAVVILAFLTAGISLLFPGGRNIGMSSITLPLSAVQTVTTAPSLGGQVLTIMSAAGAITAKLSASEAERVQAHILAAA